MLDVVEIKPAGVPKSAVIWLHGLGADGYDFVDIAPSLDLSAELNTHFIFPHAPMRKVAFVGNQIIRAWFDIDNLISNTNRYEQGIRESANLINELIDKEIAVGVPGDKIVLAGFSQGGVISLHSGLRYFKKLAGILVMSSWLPMKKEVESERSLENQNTPILIQHGIHDELIPLVWAEDSKNHLQKLGYNVEFSSYSMGHTVCSEEISRIAHWIKKVLA